SRHVPPGLSDGGGSGKRRPDHARKRVRVRARGTTSERSPHGEGAARYGLPSTRERPRPGHALLTTTPPRARESACSPWLSGAKITTIQDEAQRRIRKSDSQNAM